MLVYMVERVYRDGGRPASVLSIWSTLDRAQAWAERNAVTDARECGASPNPAFVEGCRAFVEEAVTPEQAGFEWARENELDETCRCRGGGAGFEAGCAAYVTESGR